MGRKVWADSALVRANLSEGARKRSSLVRLRHLAANSANSRRCRQAGERHTRECTCLRLCPGGESASHRLIRHVTSSLIVVLPSQRYTLHARVRRGGGHAPRPHPRGHNGLRPQRLHPPADPALHGGGKDARRPEVGAQLCMHAVPQQQAQRRGQPPRGSFAPPSGQC